MGLSREQTSGQNGPKKGRREWGALFYRCSIFWTHPVHYTRNHYTTTSTSVGPTQSIGKGEDQPLDKKNSTTPTFPGGFLPDTRKFGEKKYDKDKGKKQEKSMGKPSPPI